MRLGKSFWIRLLSASLTLAVLAWEYAVPLPGTLLTALALICWGATSDGGEGR